MTVPQPHPTSTSSRSWEPPRLLHPERVLADIADGLSVRFAGVFSSGTVERYVVESYDLLAQSATVTTHLPSLTARFAAERLQACAQARGEAPTPVPEVLFVCVHNAGRSQMAAALLDSLADGRVHVRSAGSTPAAEVDPAVVAVMDEAGVDVSQEFPKPLTDEVVAAADVVVTMGCGDACPVYPGKRYLDWDLPDPRGQDLATVRDIRADVEARVAGLLSDLVGGPVAPDGSRG